MNKIYNKKKTTTNKKMYGYLTFFQNMINFFTFSLTLVLQNKRI
jgi:hypothetical protein